jgi:HK97 family phage prohead protease
LDPDLIFKQLGVDLVKEADHLEVLDEGSSHFKILARGHDKNSDGTWPGSTLTAAVGKDQDDVEEWLLNGIASSTIKDRHGDVMLPTALIDMERAANDSLTMFLNHEYKVPEDVAGTVKSAKIVSFGVEQDTGAPIYDLDYSFRVNKINDRAKDSFLAIKGNTKLGLSIGARIPEGGAIRNKKTGRLLIAHVDLLETSIVGVPANPRSWVEMAVKSMQEPKKVFALGGVALSVTEADSLEPVEEPVVMEGVEVPLGATATLEVREDGSSTVTIEDSATPSQDAPQSTPGNDGSTASDDVVAASPAPDVQADIDKWGPAELIRGLAEASATISDLTVKLGDAVRFAESQKERAANAERERDRVIAGAQALAVDTAQIIQRLGSLPVGQRASYKRIAADFNDGLESAKDIYGDDTIALLRSMNKQ